MTNDTAVADTAVATQQSILDIVREVLGRPEMGLDDDMFDYGATSLSFVRVLASVSQQLQLTVWPPALGGVSTARNIAANATPANN